MPTSETMTDAPPGPEHQVSLPALPATPLLIDEEPLLVPPRLAAAIGLNEAIVLQQIRYWLGDKRRPKIRDGRRWVYNTYPQWQTNLATAYLTHVCTWKWQRIGGDQPGFPAPALTCCRVSTVFSCHR